MRTGLKLLCYVIIGVTIVACNSDDNATEVFEPTSAENADRIKLLMNNRSFRQFSPGVDASPRKGVVISFFSREDSKLSLWAQFAEGNVAISEWEIKATAYEVLKNRDSEIYKFKFKGITTEQMLPNKCADCIPVDTISLLVQNPSDAEQIRFRIETNADLPSPYPIFTSWTKFSEDLILSN